MIGWYVDVGYVKLDYTGAYQNLTINDIIFTDCNRPMLFPTKNFDIESIEFDNTQGSLYLDKLLEMFGNDYYKLYGIPQSKYNTDTVGIIDLNATIPSYMLSFPNLWSFFNSYTSTGPYTVLKWVIRNPVNGNVIYYDSGYNLYEYIKSGDDIQFYRRFTSVSSNSQQTYRDNVAVIVTFPNPDTLDDYIVVNCQTPITWASGSNKYRIRTIQYSFDGYRFLFDGVAPTIKDDPYAPGGDSGEGDLPPGTFDDTSDPIPDSPLPTLSASDTGFTRIYNPTLSQVQALARYLWTEPSILETIWNHIKQFFEDPMQSIIGFNLVPCRVPDGGTKSFALMFIDTGVQMTVAANQFVDVDCGSFALERYYGSALDQNPYTKVSCYLPYIGTVHLNTDEVMGTTLQVKYRIDIVSGSCVAKILVDGSVLYQYSGHCAITIPISAADFSSYVSAAIAVGTAVAGMAVGAAAGAAVPTGTMIPPPVAETAGAIAPSTAMATIDPPTDFQINMATFSHNMNVAQSQATAADFAGLTESAVINTAGQTMGSKMQVEHSGSFSGNSGYLGVRRPFLIIERPNMCLPATYGQLNGYPSMITLNLGECQGFTRVQQVQLTGCTATNPEQSEILQFLKSGVIL